VNLTFRRYNAEGARAARDTVKAVFRGGYAAAISSNWKVPISSAIGSDGDWFCTAAAGLCSPPAGAVAVMSVLRRSVSTSRTV
jgi:hypothetical protein